MARWEQPPAPALRPECGLRRVVGVIPAVVIGGGVTIGVSMLWARLFPVLWRLGRFPADAPR